MQRLQAFKFVLMPNGAQQRDMRRFAGSCRFVFNKALALQQNNHRSGGRFIGYVAMAKLLTGWRNAAQTPWLKEAPVHPLQHALKDLDRAYQNFFAGRAGFPQFKRKGDGESFRYPDVKQFEIDQLNSRIKLPKLGWIRYRNSREILGAARNITVRLSGGRYYASIQTAREVEPPRSAATDAIGIDLGIARSEPGHSRSGMGAVQAAAAVQDAMDRRPALGSARAPHQSNLPLLRARGIRQPTHPSRISVRRLRPSCQCGRGCRHQCVRARTALVSLWRGRLWSWSQDRDATSLGETGTYRSD